MSYSPPHRPEVEFRAGTITAAVWKNEQERNGQTVVTYTIRIQKRYFDRDLQKWVDSDSYFPEDLPRLRLAIDAAYQHIVLRERDPNAPRKLDVDGDGLDIPATTGQPV